MRVPHRLAQQTALRFIATGVAALAALVVTRTATAQSPAIPSPAIPSPLAQLETALVDVIDRCERSVVSISRYNQPPEVLAAGFNGRNLGGANRPPQPQIFIQGRRVLPGNLGNLQAIAEPSPLATGAGVVIDGGLVLTQYRVVKLGESHVVTDINGDRYLAGIRAADPRSGLALLAVRKRLAGGGPADDAVDLPALPLGKAEDLAKGRFVVTIGNPFAIDADGQPTASWGTITNTAARAPADENLNDTKAANDGTYRTTLHHFGSLIQTDAKLGWNTNGGAVVTLDGRLVGITTTAAVIAGHEQPAGYAIPLNDAMRRAIATMREGLEPEYGLLGIGFNRGSSRSKRSGRTGIEISGAYRGGPAQRAGLQSGDLLLEIAEEPIRTPEALQLVVGSQPPGATIEVVFERGGKEQTTKVSLGKAFVEGGQIVTRRRPAWRGLRVDYATAIPPEVLREKAPQGHLDEEGCVVVTEVDEGSVSWESGVRPYSFISHVSGQRVTTPAEFEAAVKNAKDNVKLKFTKALPSIANGVANPG